MGEPTEFPQPQYYHNRLTQTESKDYGTIVHHSRRFSRPKQLSHLLDIEAPTTKRLRMQIINLPLRPRCHARTTSTSAARLLLLATLAANVAMGLTELQWNPWSATSCGGIGDSSYDFCATLEFCAAGVSSGVASTFGYRLPGTTACGITTAPLIRMRPGFKYALTLSNRATGLAGLTGTTNIHTHGLHISGDGNADDITRRVTPGMGLVYTYKIPPDHGAGTFWYHAHFHQHTTAQVSGGAFGMLIIEERDDFATNAGVLTWLNRANERLLMASRIVFSNGSIQYCGNGVANPLLPPIIANSWYRLRVLTLDTNAATASLVVGGSSCEVRAVAYDGVWRSSIPASSRNNTYTMTGASRIDVAIKCSSGNHTIRWNGGAVATLVATSGTPTVATPYVNGLAWSPARPFYLQSLTNSIYNTNTARILVRPTCIKLNSTDTTCRSTDQWNAATPEATMSYNTVQQWDISANGLGPHSFHLHIYHVQVVGTYDVSGNRKFGFDCGHHQYGEWYDVISGFCIVRFRMIDFGGRVVLHCHVLKHGDDGSMIWINVAGGPPVDRTFIDPTTLQPTRRPTTRRPTQRPTTRQPTRRPTTRRPTTRQPTRRPTTRQPTQPPTTRQPTQPPTTRHPTTRQPTQQPTTSKPTQRPVTSNPTPMTTSPRPITSQPTSWIPSTSEPPSQNPSTILPSSFHPTSSQPMTLKPSTVQPTSSPETHFSPEPSAIPSAETPSTSPTERPSRTASPSENPSTANPVALAA